MSWDDSVPGPRLSLLEPVAGETRALIRSALRRYGLGRGWSRAQPPWLVRPGGVALVLGPALEAGRDWHRRLGQVGRAVMRRLRRWFMRTLRTAVRTRQGHDGAGIWLGMELASWPDRLRREALRLRMRPPVAAMGMPAVAVMAPDPGHPDPPRRRIDPAARHPVIAHPGPVPVALEPDIAESGRLATVFDQGRRRRMDGDGEGRVVVMGRRQHSTAPQQDSGKQEGEAGEG